MGYSGGETVVLSCFALKFINSRVEQNGMRNALGLVCCSFASDGKYKDLVP
jgi:hypothetical protein